MTVEFGMFSEEGNVVVASLVEMARTHNLPPVVVMSLMTALGRDARFGEITDTEVRECIGCALGWYE